MWTSSNPLDCQCSQQWTLCRQVTPTECWATCWPHAQGSQTPESYLRTSTPGYQGGTFLHIMYMPMPPVPCFLWLAIVQPSYSPVLTLSAVSYPRLCEAESRLVSVPWTKGVMAPDRRDLLPTPIGEFSEFDICGSSELVLWVACQPLPGPSTLFLDDLSASLSEWESQVAETVLWLSFFFLVCCSSGFLCRLLSYHASGHVWTCLHTFSVWHQVTQRQHLVTLLRTHFRPV